MFTLVSTDAKEHVQSAPALSTNTEQRGHGLRVGLEALLLSHHLEDHHGILELMTAPKELQEEEISCLRERDVVAVGLFKQGFGMNGVRLLPAGIQERVEGRLIGSVAKNNHVFNSHPCMREVPGIGLNASQHHACGAVDIRK